MTKTPSAPFIISDHLDDEKVRQEYLRAAAADPDPNVLLEALQDVSKALHNIARARGISTTGGR